MTDTVLITDCDMGEAVLERRVLEEAGYRVVHAACRGEEETAAEAARTGAVGLLVQYAPITRRVLRAAPGVRAVVRYGVGLDNVDLDAAGELGVAALNVPGYGSAEVADHTMALLLASLRRIPLWAGKTAQGRWPARGALPDPMELGRCRLGLFGFGAIARGVASRAAAFGMDVAAHDPFVAPADMAAAGVRPVEWTELWENSTAVSVHAPLTPDTRAAVGADALALAEPGLALVNTARAGLVDRAGVADALETGKLGAAAFDVWWQEPADPADPLLADPRVLVTPHIAWLSPGSLRRLRTGAADRLLEALTSGP